MEWSHGMDGKDSTRMLLRFISQGNVDCKAPLDGALQLSQQWDSINLILLYRSLSRVSSWKNK